MTTKNQCNHPATRQVGPDYGFSAPVAVPPYTEENPSAHGNIVRTEECTACGARRSVAINGRHIEYGPWGPDRVTREQAEREQAERTERARRRAQLEVGRQIAAANHTYITGIDPDGTVRLLVAGERRHVTRDALHAAAEQPDTGDGLVPYYLAVLDAVERYPYPTRCSPAQFFRVGK